MKKSSILAILLSAVVAAAPPDPRLATAKTVYLEPIDPLEGDRPVAACIAEHLPTALPLEVVTDKAGADFVLRVKGRISGETTRKLTGALGLVQLWAIAPDGAKLWDGFRSESTNTSVQLPPTAADVPCILADIGIELLRNGMKKARDAKR